MPEESPSFDKTLSDAVAAGFGALAIPTAILVIALDILGLNVGMILLVALAILTGLAAILASLLRGKRLPREIAPARGARSGVRAGLICLLVGGATFVLFGTLLSLGFFGTSILAIPAAFVLLGILALTVLPVLLTSMISGWLTARVKSLCCPADGDLALQETGAFPSEPAAETPKPSRCRTALPYIFLLSGLCYGSPFLSLIMPNREEPVEVAVEPSAASDKSLESEDPISDQKADQPKEVSPPPPPYRYEKPDGFDEAGANRLTIVERKRVNGVIGAAPVKISPDGTQVAFFRKRFTGQSLIVLRLSDRKELSKIKLNTIAMGLAWSQDSRRIFYLSSTQPRYAGVVDVENESNTELPIPTGERLPSAGTILAWPFDKQVILAAQADYAFLDLNSLRVQPLDRLASWTALSKEKREQALSQAVGSYYTSQRWTLEPVEEVTAYRPPNPFQRGWKHRTSSSFAIKDGHVTHQRSIPISPLARGEHLIATPDRSIFILTRKNSAEFLYFGLREAQGIRGDLTQSDLIPGEELPPILEAHITQNTLSAFICPPLVNPLTGHVVGPNRDRVRGIARIRMNSEGKIEFWISEEYERVRKGDLLADLHYWNNNEPRVLALPELESWWIPLPPLSSLRNDLLVKRDDVPKRTDTTHGASAITPRRPSATPQVHAQGSVEQMLEAFVIAHHLKVTTKNIASFANDYAPKVDYFDHGGVTQQFIEADQRKYQTKFNKVTETVRGEIRIRDARQGLYLANYKLESLIEGKEASDSQRIQSDVTLGMRVVGKSVVIVLQRSKVTDVEHGEP